MWRYYPRQRHREDENVGENVGPCLCDIHYRRIDAYTRASNDICPRFGDGDTLKEISEKEGDGPYDDSAYHRPRSR